MKTENYAGGVLECSGECPACAYANHEFSLPCGMVYEDELCTISQDWQIPINGFMIVAPVRHVLLFEELSKEERIHLFEMVNKVTYCLRRLNIAKEFNVIFEEKKGIHLHIWVLPRDGFKELGINPTKEISKLFDYALNNLKTEENLQKILETSRLLKEELRKEMLKEE